MVLQITSLSADVLKILEIFIEAENNPPQEHRMLTEEEIKVIADFQDPGVQEAFTRGLVQLHDALVQDLASKGPLPVSISPIGPAPGSATGSNMAVNAGHYPNAFYDYNRFATPGKTISPPQSTTPPRSQSPPRSGANRRPPSKRKYETTRDSPFTSCQWMSCGQVVENSSTAIIEHLLSRHRIDLKSRNGTMVCEWSDCGDNLLITSIGKHITSTHLRLTVVECPYCPDNRHFSREDSLNAHIKAQSIHHVGYQSHIHSFSSSKYPYI